MSFIIKQKSIVNIYIYLFHLNDLCILLLFRIELVFFHHILLSGKLTGVIYILLYCPA